MINRCAVIVRPREPYLDWAAGVDDSGIVPDPSDEPTVYLIPDCDDPSEAMELLADGYDAIFVTELWGWHTVESAWPSNRTFAMFQKWFELSIFTCVDDLCDGEILDDDEDA